jgi:oligopeptide/dipeptide ABC transporter ATP-binding protein
VAPLLRVQDLKVQFFGSGGTVNAVDGVSFDVDRGEIVGIVGESGSGKTMTALSILRLIPDPGRITNGRVLFGEHDVLQMSDDEIREFRGKDVAMIFQDPMTSLNPVLGVGFQVEEAMAAHERFTRKQARERVVPMLQRVRIPAAADRARDYPHQFSGGMRQRAMIAMGISNEPSLLIADEPTTALDVTVQASIIELLRDLSRELGASVILITHNMALIASLCQRVIVMYAGRIVEEGPTRAIFKNPQHPYTWSLLRSIKGMPPDLSKPPPGCKFHPRCRFKVDRCFTEEPPLDEVGPGQHARCWVLMKNVPNPEAQT